MRMYRSADWSRLGRAVYSARMRAGYQDTKKWADHVGRSTRTLLGLERGEEVGTGTITAIEIALGWPPQWAYSVLNDPSIGPPPARFVSPASDADSVTEDEFRYRRPEGMSEEQWARIRAATQGYIDAQIEQASQER